MSESANPFRRDGPVRVIGHRGAAGVAPENTIPAFEHAVDAGMDAVECDLQCTRDDVLVVMHDSRVDRVTEASGSVENLTYDEIKQLDAGYNFSPEGRQGYPFRDEGIRIPRFEEVLEVTGDLPIIVDVKSRRAGYRLGKWFLESQHGSRARARMIVGGFSGKVLEPVRKEARWSCATRDDLRWYILLHKIGLGRAFAPDRADALMLPPRFKQFLSVITPSFVERANRDGLGVYAWTINEPDRMRHFYDLGVDGILSDFPERLKRVHEGMED